MKWQGFLDDESRRNLIELARDGLAANRLSRRANALVLLYLMTTRSESGAVFTRKMGSMG
jgi:hypothetical protein